MQIIAGFHTPHSPSVPWRSVLTKVSDVVMSFRVVWLYSYKDSRGKKTNNNGNTKDVFLTKTHACSSVLVSLDGDSDTGTTVASTSLIFFWAIFFSSEDLPRSFVPNAMLNTPFTVSYEL